MKSNFIPIVALLKLLLCTTSTYQVHSLEAVKDYEAPPSDETILDLTSVIPASDTFEKSNLRKGGSEAGNPKADLVATSTVHDSPKEDHERYLSSISSSMQQMLNLINNERQRHGRGRLCFNDKLIVAAQRHTNDMIQRDYFSHTSRDGSSMSDRVNRVNYSWSNLAENIAINSSVQGAHDALMRSTGHRNNILNPDLKQIGIGFGRQTQGRYRGQLYVTQVFGKPRSGESCSGGTNRQCRNEPSFWYDSDGPKYNCNWYALGSNCAKYGSGHRNFGKTANEACCACGGGTN